MRAAVILAFAFCALASRGAAADARHLRFATNNGPIHVWIPDGYDRAHAGVVVYVHGYFANVDDAWTKYNLADQFARSGVNAVFVACEAPTSDDDNVSWSSLTELLGAVHQNLGAVMPRGRVVAVGHSGAHRTLVRWLDEEALDTVVLLDALYGEVTELKNWLDASPGHRLIDVGDQETRPWTNKLHQIVPETVTYDGLSDSLARATRDRVVYVRTNVGHMPLITEGEALPKVLAAVGLPQVHGNPGIGSQD